MKRDLRQARILKYPPDKIEDRNNSYLDKLSELTRKKDRLIQKPKQNE